MAASGTDDEAVAQAVLALNPIDPEALHRIAAIRTAQKRYKQAAQMWKGLAEIEPQNPDVWTFWGSASYAAGDFDSSEKALARAATLGATSSELIDTRARLRIRQSDYAGGLHFADDALKRNRADQDAWLLRADCAQNLDQWSIQAESLEHAISLGPVPFAKRTELITLYLKHGAADQALRHLNAALSDLPHDAPVLAHYAEFWEQAGDPKRAEGLWNTALALDPKCEPAVVGLSSHLIREGRAADALQLTEQGLESVPGSTRTSLLKAGPRIAPPLLCSAADAFKVEVPRCRTPESACSTGRLVRLR